MALEKFAEDSVIFDFDCTKLLAATETITSSPTMSQLPALSGDAVLVFGTATVNTVPITYPDGRVMAVGKGFQVRISAGEPVNDFVKRVYSVLGEIETSEDSILTTKAELWVLPPGINA